MTRFLYFFLILGVFAVYGCAEQAAEGTPETAAAEQVIELSEEELDLLDAPVDTSQADLGDINADNYEEALEKLEQAIEVE